MSDVVRALADLMHRDDVYGEVFNIGSDEEVSISDLAERVRDSCQSRSEIARISYDDAYEAGFEDMERRIPDLSKIHEKLGWQEVAWTTLPSCSYQQDVHDLYAKIMRDVRDSQRTFGLCPRG